MNNNADKTAKLTAEMTNIVRQLKECGVGMETCISIVGDVYEEAKVETKAPKAKAYNEAKVETKAPKAKAYNEAKVETKAPKANGEAAAKVGDKAGLHKQYEMFILKLAERMWRCKDKNELRQLMLQKPNKNTQHTNWFFFQKDCGELAVMVARNNYTFQVIENGILQNLTMTASSFKTLEEWLDEAKWLQDWLKEHSTKVNGQNEGDDVVDEEETTTKIIQEQSQEIMIPKRAEKACKFLLDALECIEEKASSDVERIMKLLNSTYCKTGKTFWDKMREMMEIVFEEACWRLPRTLEGSILNWAIHASIDHTLNQHTFAEVVADPKWAQEHEFIQIPENETGSLVTYKALKGEVVVRKD